MNELDCLLEIHFDDHINYCPLKRNLDFLFRASTFFR